MKKDYYIQANTDKSEEIKYTFEKLGYNVGGWVFTSGLYYTLNGNINITNIGSNEYYLVINNPNYEELNLKRMPKFKPGTWLWHKTKGVFPLMVEDYDEKEGYLMQFTDETKCYFGRDIIENDYRLWNFGDSKLGDILYDKAYNRIGIFENFGHHPDGGSFNDKTYCYLILYYDVDDNEFYEKTRNDMDGYDAIPATREQRDLLFQKMKEAGYQWDADKKELSKIKLPNFKTGDWIITDKNHVWFVDKDCSTTGYLYRLIAPHGKVEVGEYEAVDAHSRLWSIADAKDGDVLTNGKLIVIFNKLEEPAYRQHIIAYAGLDLCGKLQITEDTWQLGVDKAMPATKEQCDLLFAKMQEAGYEWDAEKKELKEFPKHYDIANFHVGMPVLVRPDNDCTWDYSVFSRITGNEYWKFSVCNGVNFTQCIPFEDNETLLGTTDMCNERFINW